MHSFAKSDGFDPTASLIDVGGVLYGTTHYGGLYGYGTVFSVNPASGAAGTIHSFDHRPDGAFPSTSLTDVAGELYGVTSSGGIYNGGTIFTLNPMTGVERVVHAFGRGIAGSLPAASLTKVGRLLYGTTMQGGAYNAGTLFSLDPTSDAIQVVYTFKAGYDGANPSARLIDVGGTLYGTTFAGGPPSGEYGCSVGCGTVFAFTP